MVIIELMYRTVMCYKNLHNCKTLAGLSLGRETVSNRSEVVDSEFLLQYYAVFEEESL